MHRLSMVIREINRGLKVDEKSGERILDWSPNNVRRLIIGWDYFIIQYHVTGGKFTKTLELKNITQYAQKDATLIQGNQTEQIKPIINALVDGRVCSNIEEIIFDVSNYNGVAFSIDTNLAKLVGRDNDKSKLATRFPRLQGVFQVDSDFRQMGEAAQKCKTPNTSVVEMLKEQGVNISGVYISPNFVDGSWKKGSSVRPQYYEFDNALQGHFEKIRFAIKDTERQDKLGELEYKRSIETLNSTLPPVIRILKELEVVKDGTQTIFSNASIISKSEWALYCSSSATLRGVKKELLSKYNEAPKKGEDSLLNSFRRIDFNGIYGLLSVDNRNTDIEALQKFEGYMQGILDGTPLEQYKRDSNITDIKVSLTALGKIATVVYNIHANIVYLVLGEFLARNTPKYAEDFLVDLKVDLTGLKYTRVQMEYYNRILPSEKYGYAKDAFDQVGYIEVTTNTFPIAEKVQMVRKILKALS